ncbi:MAG TPA: CHRD domain-containing protein [Vicinamibacterales bacterium]|nr:CHRD domain-containing protein [Vicinamibacterales bacterium]
MQLVIALVVGLVAASAAQAPGKLQFRARLSPVPLDVAMQNIIAGSGSATASLAGDQLTINGTFMGLRSPATTAWIHIGTKGIRGPATWILQVNGGATGTSGVITGIVTLTPAQIDDFKNSRFYIQLHSEKAPDGNLWGWLLPQEVRR